MTVRVGAVLVLAGIFALGCATLTPEGAKVRYTTNPQATAGCKFLGDVKGKFDNDLRNEAAKLGADVVFNQTQHNEIHIWQHGEAYKCGEGPLPKSPGESHPSPSRLSSG